MEVLLGSELMVGSFSFDFELIASSTYDSSVNRMRYSDSTGYWWKSTYNSRGKQLTYKDSTGYWEERTYDSCGNVVSYSDSTGDNITY